MVVFGGVDADLMVVSGAINTEIAELQVNEMVVGSE